MSKPKLIECPSCNKQISSAADFCPHCGQPITEELREKAVQKVMDKIAGDAHTTKITRCGCLLIVSLFAAYVTYSAYFTETKTFEFNESQFMSKFLQRIEQNNIRKDYGNMQCIKESSDKEKTVYKLSRDIKFYGDVKLEIGKAKSGKIHGVSIGYDQKRTYDAALVVAATTCVSLVFFDFGLIGMSNVDKIPGVVRNIMSLPQEKRKNQEVQDFMGRTINKETGKETTNIHIKVAPVFSHISFSMPL